MSECRYEYKIIKVIESVDEQIIESGNSKMCISESVCIDAGCCGMLSKRSGIEIEWKKATEEKLYVGETGRCVKLSETCEIGDVEDIVGWLVLKVCMNK